MCTASIAGVTDTPTLPPYGVSKHAVVGLAAAMRRELDHRGVGVSVLCPGLIRTRIFESERNRPAGMDDPADDNATSKAYRDMIDHGAPPSHVAEVVYQAIIDNQFFVFPTATSTRGRGPARRHPPGHGMARHALPGCQLNHRTSQG